MQDVKLFSRGSWRAIAGRRGFSCCSWWLHDGSAVWVWWHLVEFCLKYALSTRGLLARGLLATFQLQLGLMISFLRPTSQRHQLLKSSCLHGCHNSLCRPVPQAFTHSVCRCHRATSYWLLAPLCTPDSLLPAFPVTVNRIQIWQKAKFSAISWAEPQP